MASENHPDWYIVLTEPQQEMTTVWRLHDAGHELFVPIVRERRSTNKKDKCGRKIVVLRPRPMFPGYGFLRSNGVTDLNKIIDVRGVRDVLRDRGRPVTLADAAVQAIFRKQHEEHQDFMRAKGGRLSPFKRGDLVRIDEGGVYSGLIANVDRIDARGRIEVLLGMIRHSLPADMVVAA